mgnify:CR=1 FL=1
MKYLGDADGQLFSHRRGPRPGSVHLRCSRWPHRALAADAFGAGAGARFARRRHLVRRRTRGAGFRRGPAQRLGLGGAHLLRLLRRRPARPLQRHRRKALEGSDSGKVDYFEGTPIPTSVALTGVLAFAAWHGRLGDNLYWGVWKLGPWELHPLVLLFVLSGTLMISKTLRIPKL